MNTQKLVEWVRRYPAAAGAPGAIVVLIGAGAVFGWALIPLMLTALCIAIIYTAIAFVLFDARPIAREVAAKKWEVDPERITTVPLRAQLAPRAPTYNVPTLPASTAIVQTPVSPVDLDDGTFTVPMPPPLPPSTEKVNVQSGIRPEWPLLHADRVDFTQPIPVGYDELGNIVYVKLDQRTLLIGAEMGWGKSTIIHILTAAAALDARVRLTVIDVKLVTMTKWKGSAERWVGDDIGEANRVLTQLRAEMRRRYAYMAENHLELLTPTDARPLEVLIVDELETLTDDDTFVANLVDITRLGRAAGIIVIAATQEPRADVIPKKLTNKFVFRWAGRCADVAQVRMVIGARYRQAPAHLLDAADKGLGYLMHEGAAPVKLQAFFLTESDIRTIAERAEQVRRSTRSRPVPDPFPTRSGEGAGTGSLSVEQVSELVPERVWHKLRVERLTAQQIVQDQVGADRRGRAYQEAWEMVNEALRQGPLRVVKDEGEENR
jgi:S-DNA-T family DNA segregation ATPase FtsK/SpoIIIE